MKLSKILITAVLLTLPLTGCAVNHTKVTYDEELDFDTLNTYNWLDTMETTQVDQLENNFVRVAVDKQMAQKGFKLVSIDPDFLIKQNISTEMITDRHWERDIRNSIGPMYFFKYTYQKGTIVIELIDPRRKDMIWKGKSSSEVETVITTKTRKKRIEEVVANIMENFPPKQKQAITKLNK